MALCPSAGDHLDCEGVVVQEAPLVHSGRGFGDHTMLIPKTVQPNQASLFRGIAVTTTSGEL